MQPTTEDTEREDIIFDNWYYFPLGGEEPVSHCVELNQTVSKFFDKSK